MRWLLVLLAACAGRPTSAPVVVPAQSSAPLSETLVDEVPSPRDPALDDAHAVMATNPMGAALAFVDITKRDPKNCEAWVNAGIAFERAKEGARAENVYAEAAARLPGCAEAWSALAGLTLRDAKFEKAEATIRKGLVAHAQHIGLRLRLAEALIAQNKLKDAEKISLEVLKRDERNAGAMLNLSRIYYAQKKLELALLAANNAKELAPERGDIYHQLGVIFLRKDERPQALAMFRKAVECDPTLVASQVNIAQLAAETSDAEGALAAAEAAIAYAPGALIAKQALANAYRGAQRYQDAEKTYLQILQEDPKNADATYNLATLYLDADIPGIELLDRLERATRYLDAFAALVDISDGEKNQALVESAQAKRRIDTEKKRRDREEKRKSKKAAATPQ